ncbi:MAG: hypothetical protein M4579_001980 [Chaenotheca gracillima]|nr:MAG: hypothetical protein M4579_001980 [Chaenotheca gracillima]
MAGEEADERLNTADTAFAVGGLEFASVFSPVRRPGPHPYGVPSPYANQAPWTTARCNRMVRPLIAKLGVLKRLSPTGQHQPNRNYRVKRTNDDEDSDWALHHVASGRLRNKYSGRKGKSGKKQQQRHIKKSELEDLLDIDLAPGILKFDLAILFRTTKDEPPFDEPTPAIQEDVEVDLSPGLVANWVNTGVLLHQASKIPSRETFAQAFNTLKKTLAFAQINCYEGLSSTFEVMLKSTRSQRPMSPTGAASLFQTCLKQLPALIKSEEEHAKKKAEEDETWRAGQLDVPTEIFNELEELSIGARPGYKPLREAARAHGVSLLCEAIKNHEVHPEYMKPLVLMCVENQAFKEGEMLLSAMASSGPALYEPSSLQCKLFDSATSIELFTLDFWTTTTRRRGFLFRQMTLLLKDGSLPIPWLSTEGCTGLWNLVLREISREGEDVLYAAEFAQTALEVVSGCSHGPFTSTDRLAGFSVKMSHAFTDTFYSLLATFTSMVLLDMERLPHDHGELRELPNSSAMHILLAANSAVRRELIDNETGQLRDDVDIEDWENSAGIVFANIVVLLQARRHTPKIFEHQLSINLGILDSLTQALVLHHSTTSERSPRPPPFVEDLAQLLNIISRYCGAAQSDKGFRQIQDFVDLLFNLSEDQSITSLPEKGLYQINRIARESAFQFADLSSERDPMQWAEQVDKKFYALKAVAKRSGTASDTPTRSKRAHAAAYRWDAGLSEWILATPAVAQFKAAQVAHQNSVGSSSRESENRFDTTPSKEGEHTSVEGTPALSEPSLGPENQDSVIVDDSSVIDSDAFDSESEEIGISEHDSQLSEGSEYVAPRSENVVKKRKRSGKVSGPPSSRMRTMDGGSSPRSSVSGNGDSWKAQNGDPFSFSASTNNSFVIALPKPISTIRRNLRNISIGGRNLTTLEDADQAVVAHRSWKGNVLPSRLGPHATKPKVSPRIVPDSPTAFDTADEDDELLVDLDISKIHRGSGLLLDEKSSNRLVRPVRSQKPDINKIAARSRRHSVRRQKSVSDFGSNMDSDFEDENITRSTLHGRTMASDRFQPAKGRVAAWRAKSKSVQVLLTGDRRLDRVSVPTNFDVIDSEDEL